MRVWLLALAVVLTACGSSQEVATISGQPPAPDPTRRFAVAVPSDGRYGETVYSGSGEATARALQRALLARGASAEVVGPTPSQEAAVASARAARADFLLLPVITHWEDRATEWSGLPDRIEVMVSLVDVRTGQLAHRSSITGRSSWWTFGGDRPQDLLAAPATNYAASLF